jgi:hypothetical protein
MKNIVICHNFGFGCPKYEDFANAFFENGNNVLIAICDPKKKDSDVFKQIINFKPDIIFSFNNILPVSVLDAVNCKVCVVDVDDILSFLNKETLSHPNVYLIGYHSRSDELYKKIPNFQFNQKKYSYISFAATNFKKNSSVEKFPIVFIGTNMMRYHGYEKTKQYSHEQVLKIFEESKNKWHSEDNSFEDLKHCFNAQKRIKYLSELSDLGLKIYGDDTWKDIFKYDVELAKCYVEEEVRTVEKSELLYNGAKISVNISHDQAVNAFSFRVPEIMASNSCLLTEDKKEWDDLFGEYISKEVKEAILYKDRFDLRKKCIRLLEYEDFRLRCVKECQDAIKHNGRWHHRIKKMEEFLSIKLLNNNNGQRTELVKISNKFSSTKSDFIKKVNKVSDFKRPKSTTRIYYSFAIFFSTLPFFRATAFFKIMRLEYITKLYSYYISKEKMVSKNRNISKRVVLSFFYNLRKWILSKIRFRLKGKVIRIIFLVHLPSSWDALSSIYEECVKDKIIDPLVVSIPRRQYDQHKDFRYSNENYDFLKDKGIPVINGYDRDRNQYIDLKEFSPDIVFVQTPYCSQRPEIYNINNLVKFTKVAYLQYAFIITAGDFEPHFYSTKFHQKCWKIFAETSYHKSLYKKYGLHDYEKKVIVSGYPKFDRYNYPLSEKSKNIWKISKELNPDIKRIIWCPHWTIDKIFNSSSFLKYHRYFLDLAKINNIELIIRPHPLLFEELLVKNLMSKNDLDSYLTEISVLPNVSVNSIGDYFDLFRTSDALISDNSSFLAEYLPTNNPIIYTHSYENNFVNLNEYGIELTKYHYIAKNKKELDELIKRTVIGCDDYNRNLRVDNAKKHMGFIEKNSGLFIKDYIKKYFGFTNE